MSRHFNCLGKAASVTALMLGVAFAAAQKASAQVITGAGASSVTTLLSSQGGPVFNYTSSLGYPYRYVVTGSGTGRTEFLSGRTDFVATDGLGTSFGAGASVQNNTIVDAGGAPVIDPFTGSPYVVVNQATLNIAFAYNVPGFIVDIDGLTACRIFRGNAIQGDPTNWSQVTNVFGEQGPDLPIRRVADGNVSGETATLQGNGNFSDINPATGLPKGFVDACNSQGFSIPSIVGNSSTLTSGTNIPNFNLNRDIIVPAASVNGVTADPIGLANLTGDDNNSGSYTFGVLSTIASVPGAIGYAETAAARFFGFTEFSDFGLAVDADNGLSTAAVGPTYVVFHQNYFDDAKNVAAQNVCYGAIFSSFLNQAGFNVDSSVFPYNPANSSQAGGDTDNYGSFGSLASGFDFGPCSGITPIPLSIFPLPRPPKGIPATLVGNALTFAGNVIPQVGDTVVAANTNGQFVFRGVIVNIPRPTTVQVYVNLPNYSSIYQFSGNTEAPTLYTFSR